MPKPELDRMNAEQKAQAHDFMVDTWYEGLGVETMCMHDGEFAAVLLLPRSFGEPDMAPSVLRELVILANQEADLLDAQERGMRQLGDPAKANMLVLDPGDQTPAADALFRVGFAPVSVRSPSCMILFSGDYAVTGWTLRTFARLATEQANAIDAAYAAEERRAETRPRSGPKRAPAFGERGDPRSAPAPAFDYAPEPMPVEMPESRADPRERRRARAPARGRAATGERRPGSGPGTARSSDAPGTLVDGGPRRRGRAREGARSRGAARPFPAAAVRGSWPGPEAMSR